MKKTITEYHGIISLLDWDGETFSAFRAYINNLDVPDGTILEHDYDSKYWSLEERREETDEEYSARIEKETQQRNKTLQEQEDRDKREYLRLKAKFEK